MAWQEGLIGGLGGGGAAAGLRLDLLSFHLALLPATTQGKEVVLGKAGDKAELPCQASQKKNMKFSWKYSGIKVLENSFLGSYMMLGRMARLPFQGENHC